MKDYGFYGKGIDGYIHYMQGMDEAEKARPKQKTARSGGCLGMILMVIALSTGFSAAFLSMLSAL